MLKRRGLSFGLSEKRKACKILLVLFLVIIYAASYVPVFGFSESNVKKGKISTTLEKKIHENPNKSLPVIIFLDSSESRNGMKTRESAKRELCF